MIKFKNTFISIIFIFISTISSYSYSQSSQLSNSAQVSLLTNKSWDKEIYAIFGHTGIRVVDPQNNIDFVFNYGLFDFNSPNFMYRFAKGETDYLVAPIPFSYYIEEYKHRGITTIEQVLNISQKEKQKIWDALCLNALPENRLYRYNYFFDNCSTRPRDIIEKNIEGDITYSPTSKKQTFRDLINEAASNTPWYGFGMNLVVGSKADREASDREKMFLPMYLKNAYDGAVINNNGTKRKLVASEQVLTDFPTTDTKPNFLISSPLFIGCLLLLISVVITTSNYRKKLIITGKIFDTFLFTIAGIAGCVITFLTFFSEHPYVDSNWNIIWLNPFQLIASSLFFVKFKSKYINYYHFINFALLTLLLLFLWLIPQQLDFSFIPFILCIWLRFGMNFVQCKRIGITKP